MRKWRNGFLDKTDETIISPTPPPWQMINVGGKNVRLYCLYWLAYWWTQKLHKTSVCMKCAWIVCFFGVKSCYMTTAYFSSLPPLKQKLWGNFHDYERALVTTEQENNVSEKTHVSLRIVKNIRFCIFFFHFHVVTVVLLCIIGYNNYFFGLALSKCLWKHWVRSRTKFQLY